LIEKQGEYLWLQPASSRYKRLSREVKLLQSPLQAAVEIVVILMNHDYFLTNEKDIREADQMKSAGK